MYFFIYLIYIRTSFHGGTGGTPHNSTRKGRNNMNTYFCPFTNGYCKGSDCRLFDDGCAFNRISFALLDIADNGISVRVENSKDVDTLCNSLSDIEVGISDIASVIQDK